jgi:AcrR family transcriptional regulator
MPPRRTPEATGQLRASLIEHAQRLIQRDGVHALTMRALAAEAGCAVGLPYKVFANREELVAELVHVELRRLRAALDAWVGEAGRRTVGENLGRYARLLLEADVPALILAEEIGGEDLDATVTDKAYESGLPASFDTTVADYLRAEQRLGRVAADVDVQAYGFLITGAIHNLLAAGESYPRPDMGRLRRMLSAVARQIAPPGSGNA